MDIVNDEYWLGYAKKAVDDSGTKLAEAATKINTLTGSFWLMYTAVFVIGSSLKKLDEPWYIMVLLVMPIPSLILAYVFALWAQMPRFGSTGIDPRIPVDIEAFYNANIKFKKRRLWWSMTVTFISGIMLAIALTLANFTHHKVSVDKKLTINYLQAQRELLVIGDIPDKTVVAIKLEHLEKEKWVSLASQNSVVYRNNHFEYTITVPAEQGRYRAAASWNDGVDPKTLHVVTKELDVPRVPEQTTNRK
jgi:hypothetical protein